MWTINNVIRKTGSIGACAVALFLLLCLLLGLAKYTLPQSPVVLLFSVVMLGVLWLVKKRALSEKISDNSFWITAIVLFVITFLTETYIVNYAPFDWATDPRLCKENAEYMLSTWALKPELADYFYMYDHNINILTVLGALYRLLGDYTYVVYVFLIWVNISSLLACLTVRNITGNNFVSLLVFALLQVFCIFTTRTYMPYTSNLALLFPILVIYVYTTKLDSTYKAILIPFIAALGWQAKLTSLIAFIAIAIIETMRYIQNNKIYTKKTVGIAITSTVISFVLCVGLKTALWNSLNYQQDDNRYKTFAYYLYLGQNTKAGGQWDAEYVNKGDLTAPSAERNAYYYSVAKQDFMDRGLFGNIKFYTAKTVICWGCTYMDYTKFNGEDSKWVFTLRHCIWFFVFACAMLSVFICRNRYNLAMLLTLTGLMIYQFLAEGSFTFVIMFSPIIFAMAGIIMNRLCKK
ncbi:MAG: hypothetical protein J5905_00845 [Prevotella sp.]|nr:hypothetical protein [Prevotella sp.]